CGEAHAEQTDVFRVFNEVTGICGHYHRQQRWRQALRNAQRYAVTHQSTDQTGGTVGTGRAAAPTEDRQTAVVVHEVTAEFGVERLKVVVHRHAELAAV